MKIGLAIYDILSNDSNVSALVSTRIYPNVAKQSSAFPFIVYQTTSTDPTDTKDGVSPLDVISFEVLCFSETYTQAVDLAEKVRNALDRNTGTHNTIITQGLSFTGADEHFDIKGEGQGIYVQSLTFNFRQSVPVDV